MPRITREDFTAEERATMRRIMQAANRRAGNHAGGSRNKRRDRDERSAPGARARDRRTARRERRAANGRFI